MGDIFDALKPLPNLWYESPDGKKRILTEEEIMSGETVYEGFPEQHYLGPQVTEEIHSADGGHVAFHTTINCIEPIVMHLVGKKGWSLVDAITLAASTCGRCLNILIEAAGGEKYPQEQRDKVHTHCELCATIDPEYDAAYKLWDANREIPSVWPVQSARFMVTAFRHFHGRMVQAQDITSTQPPSEAPAWFKPQDDSATFDDMLKLEVTDPTFGKFWITPDNRIWQVPESHQKFAEKYLGGSRAASDAGCVRIRFSDEMSFPSLIIEAKDDIALNLTAIELFVRTAYMIVVELESAGWVQVSFTLDQFIKSNTSLSNFVRERYSENLKSRGSVRTAAADEDQSKVIEEPMTVDHLSITFHDKLFDYYLSCPAMEPGWYITEIGGMKAGFGSKYQLKKFLLKLKTEFFSDGNIPASNIKIAPIPDIDEPLVRRLGGINLIAASLEDQLKAFEDNEDWEGAIKFCRKNYRDDEPYIQLLYDREIYPLISAGENPQVIDDRIDEIRDKGFGYIPSNDLALSLAKLEADRGDYISAYNRLPANHPEKEAYARQAVLRGISHNVDEKEWEPITREHRMLGRLHVAPEALQLAIDEHRFDDAAEIMRRFSLGTPEKIRQMQEAGREQYDKEKIDEMRKSISDGNFYRAHSIAHQYKLPEAHDLAVKEIEKMMREETEDIARNFGKYEAEMNDEEVNSIIERFKKDLPTPPRPKACARIPVIEHGIPPEVKKKLQRGEIASPGAWEISSGEEDQTKVINVKPTGPMF